MKIKRQKRIRILFYLLAGYTFIFIFWWTSLLISHFNEIGDLKNEVILLSNPTNTEQIAEVMQQLDRKKIMIAGEGTVFFLIFLTGFAYIRKSISKEFEFNTQKTNFLLSVTHELKSPIASIQIVLQTLLRANDRLSDDKKRQLVTTSLQESERLHNLVENLLYTARLEDKMYNPTMEQFDIVSKIKEVIEKVSLIKAGENRTVKYEGPAQLEMAGSPGGIKTLVLNLTENALKYTPDGTDVIVRLSEDERFMRLEVIDHGEGVNDEVKKLIFEKFYRTGNELTRKQKGTGLGLFICHRIMQLHNGSIKVKDNPTGGAIFSAKFPKTN